MRRRDSDSQPTVTAADEPQDETCDVCGSALISWRKCKLVCLNCGTILKSCADL